jgi:hypothetical protein
MPLLPLCCKSLAHHVCVVILLTHELCALLIEVQMGKLCLPLMPRKKLQVVSIWLEVQIITYTEWTPYLGVARAFGKDVFEKS